MFGLFEVFLVLIIVGIPISLTVLNICNCILKEQIWPKLAPMLTIFIGGFYYYMLHTATFPIGGDWNVQINYAMVHSPISTHYAGVLIVVVLGAIGYFVLLFGEADRLPPLVLALSISALILLNVFQIAYAIQISNRVYDLDQFLYIYHFNILLLSASVVYRHMQEMVLVFRIKADDMEQYPEIKTIYRWMNTLSKYSIFVFVVFFFLVAILEVIFVILGQGLDAPIKAFTDTADWTFSQQIPPPPIDYDGHYLCTVAAGGHEKVVKPLRLGTRRGETIVVNRQLCVANAFEEVIQEKFPNFHRKIRYVYDTYGYPLSRKITSPLRADFVYFVMKPLEWIFVVFLYLVDLKPEQRIRRQYAYKGKE